MSEAYGLTLEELESEAALELPERQLLALAIVGGGLVNVGVAIDQVNLSANVCGVLNNGHVTCTSSAGGPG